ncbi:MAG: hypothetical protein NC541_14140 [bacterium]|nr:hypothetical protein [bacterium]
MSDSTSTAAADAAAAAAAGPAADEAEDLDPVTPEPDEGGEIDIEDEDVPLAVIPEDNEEDAEETGQTVEIGEEETALVSAPGGEGERVWWSWLPVIGAVASAVEAYRRSREEKAETVDVRKKE